jgi:hypothetical protein
VGETVGPHAPQLLRQVLYDVVKAGVSAAAVEQINNVFAKLFAVRIVDGHFVLP